VDPVSRREFWDILTELHLEGVTLFVSTPYMDEAERCARVGLMFEGKMIVCDVPERIKGMVAGELLELRPTNLRAAQEVMARLPGVLEMQTYGDLLHIFVDDVALRQPQLEAALAAEKVEVVSLRQTRPRMEEAFISLIRKQLEEK
jgi:ABC-2 type transport system ATP-binding protein